MGVGRRHPPFDCRQRIRMFDHPRQGIPLTQCRRSPRPQPFPPPAEGIFIMNTPRAADPHDLSRFHHRGIWPRWRVPATCRRSPRPQPFPPVPPDRHGSAHLADPLRAVPDLRRHDGRAEGRRSRLLGVRLAAALELARGGVGGRVCSRTTDGPLVTHERPGYSHDPRNLPVTPLPLRSNSSASSRSLRSCSALARASSAACCAALVAASCSACF